MMEPLLEVRNVRKVYRRGRHDQTDAVCGLSFSLRQGTCLGLVGESGCGKSTLCRLLSGLELPTSGEILYRGKPVSLRQCRGRIQMVFQNSLDAVNLHTTAFHIISEPLENFFHMDKNNRRQEVGRLMALVGLPAGDMDKYPQQFSGGQLQRICIARALAAKPELLILDEPLSSLDVSVQAQLLNLLSELKRTLHLTCLLISHDLEAVYYLSDAILVMYGGRLVERLPHIGDFWNLSHPYTRRLLASHGMAGQDISLPETPGGGLPHRGCPYAPRCAWADRRCRESCPELTARKAGHEIACFHICGCAGKHGASPDSCCTIE